MGFGEKGSGEVFGCGCDYFFWSCGWHLAVVREPADGLGYPSSAGGGDPNIVAAVVPHCRPDIVSVGGMRGPGGAVFWTQVGEDFDAWGSKRGTVVVEGTVDVSICGDLWACVRRAQNVEG